MKKLVSLLLLLPSLCVAAEEREIWACQGQKSEGYEGQENDTWKSVYFEPLNYLVTIDEGNSNVKVESEVLSVACSIAPPPPRFYRCNSDDGLGITLLIDVLSGRGAISRLFGSLIAPKDASNVKTELLQCTRF